MVDNAMFLQFPTDSVSVVMHAFEHLKAELRAEQNVK